MLQTVLISAIAAWDRTLKFYKSLLFCIVECFEMQSIANILKKYCLATANFGLSILFGLPSLLLFIQNVKIPL